MEAEMKHLTDEERELFEQSKLDTTLIAGSELRMFAYRLDAARRRAAELEGALQSLWEEAIDMRSQLGQSAPWYAMKYDRRINDAFNAAIAALAPPPAPDAAPTQ